MAGALPKSYLVAMKNMKAVWFAGSLAVLLLVGSPAAAADDLVWAKGINVGNVVTVAWTNGAVGCGEFLSQGRRVRTVTIGGIKVLALAEPSDGDYTRVFTAFQSNWSVPFDVLPEEFTLAVVAPQDKAKPLPYVSPQQIAKKIARDAMWAQIGEGIASGLRASTPTSTTATSGTAVAVNSRGGVGFGTYRGTTRTYDATANQALTASNMDRIADSADARLRQETGALLANTIFPGEYYAGTVNFKREKNAKGLLLSVVIPNVFGMRFVVTFPLDVPGK